MNLDQPFSLLLRGGAALRVAELRVEADGLWVVDEDGRPLRIPLDYVESVLPAGVNAAGMLGELARVQRSDIAVLLLHLAGAWARHGPGGGGARLALFGSASLALTILPGNTSHDADAAFEPASFLPILRRELGRSKALVGRTLKLELVDWPIFQHCGKWEERASRVRMSFSMVQPGK